MSWLDALDTWVLGASAVVLAVAALVVLFRITRGPTMLDRAIAFDVLVAITICGVALDAALRRDAENLPFLLVATLLGFVGSVSVARFSPGSDDVEADDADGDPGGGPDER
ncbi:monovalent cation/H+ antiporter complex subunit F [Nocardioides marmoraquaticus]